MNNKIKEIEERLSKQEYNPFLVCKKGFPRKSVVKRLSQGKIVGAVYIK